MKQKAEHIAIDLNCENGTTTRPSNFIIIAGLAFFGILIVLPVMLAPRLMLLDAPAHEARIAILRDILSGHGSKFYYLDTFFLPNIAFDLVGLALSYIVAPESVGRIFFAATLLLTPTGLLVLNKVATGKWSIMPLLSVLLLYNLVTILGFFSYSFGIALLPWALAGRLKLEEKNAALRSIAGALISIVLLFCHLFAFGIYAIMSASFAVAALGKRQISLSRAICWVLELVPAGILYLYMSTGRGSHGSYTSPFLKSKLFGIAKAFTSGSMAADIAFLMGGACVLILFAFFSRPRVIASFWLGLVALTALYFILPANLASGSYVDARMPIVIILLFLAGVQCDFRRSWTVAGLLAAITVAFVAKQTAIAVLWTSFSPEVDTIVHALQALPADAVVMQTECSPDANNVLGVYRSRQPAMQHVAALAALNDTRFLPSIYAIPGQQPIGVQTNFQPYYELQTNFAPSCDLREYTSRQGRVETLAKAQQAAGITVPPLFFFLIRPPQTEIDLPGTDLIARDATFAIYRIAR